MSEGRASPNDSSTILRIGSRRITVEKTPLASAQIVTQTISQPSPNWLLVREQPGGRMKLMAQFVWIAFFITVCCAGIAPDTESPVVFWVLFCIVAWIPVVMWIGCAFTLFCLLFQPSSRYLFDRDEGRMKFFHQSRTLETRLLTDILAIQIIMCESGYNVMGERYERYQLNLVCNEPYEPRLNPIDTYELALVRQSGEKLAEFLEVPLLDQTQREEPIAR